MEHIISKFSDMFGTPDDMTPEIATYWLKMLKGNYEESVDELKEKFKDIETKELEHPSDVLDGFQSLICKALEMGIDALNRLQPENDRW